MIEIQNLVKKYGRFHAVDHLDLKIEEGSIFGFVGPNGAGKTTTMRILAGLLQATSGSVTINGTDVIRNPRALREKIGYMPDFFGVYHDLTMAEYMDFFAGCYYIPYAERAPIIDNLLDLVGLIHKKNDYVDTLSRGMKQRLCLARSLIHNPELLILDEPASGLDPRARYEMKEVLKQLKTLGKTIIISSHILTELSELCTVIGIIDRGKMVANGSVQDILLSMNKMKTYVIKPMVINEIVVNALYEHPKVSNIVQNIDTLEFSFGGDNEEIGALLQSLVMKGIVVVGFNEKAGNLEDIFMRLTVGGAGND